MATERAKKPKTRGPKGGGAARRPSSKGRGSKKRANAFVFIVSSLACLVLALGLILAWGLFKEPGARVAAPVAAPADSAAPVAERPVPEGPGAERPVPERPVPASVAADPAPEAKGGGAAPAIPAPPSPTKPLAAPARPAAALPSIPASRREASRRVAPPRPTPRPPAASRKTLIFVIDDAGYNMKELEPFLKLPFPLTVAVLPRLPYSVKASQAIRAAGKELILHQPMAAIGGQNPGPGAIMADSGPEEAARIIGENLETVPGAVGMNNHMGSAVTTEPPIMEAVAAIAKRRGIYYLDSLTISGTASREAALREGIRYWERDVFLDNAQDRANILRAVEDGKKRADSGRPAVMIGHVWSSELAQTLMDLYPHLVDEGYSLSTISSYMLSESADDADSRD